MKAKILAAIRQYDMFASGASVLVALSGGADSVALLHFLSSLREDLSLSLGALHLNHNLRGEESERDEAFVRRLCDGMNIPLRVQSSDVNTLARESGESVEMAGRRCRYDFFHREASALGAVVATAHTLSDSAETILLNLARGTALRGLAGISPVRGVIIRPLIDCTRSDIEDYCAAHGLDFVTDSTNSSSVYARNRIRRDILPRLEAENPRFLEKTGRMLKLLRADADYLDSLARQAARSLSLPGKGFDAAGFLALPEALRGRVLADLLRGAGLEADSRTIDTLAGLVESGKGTHSLSGKASFWCGRGVFRLEHTGPPQPYFSCEISPEQAEQGVTAEVFKGKRVKIDVIDNKNYKNSMISRKKVLNYCLDYDRISGIVCLRQRLPSDRLRQPGRGCSKTLKNLFQESGVSEFRRLRRVVLADERGVLWAEGLGADERAALSETTIRVMTIEVAEDALCPEIS